MNFPTATRTAASNYTRGTTTNQTKAAAVQTTANQVLHPAADTDLWTAAMNALLFLTADLGPSINA
jgi:hypothetical protein